MSTSSACDEIITFIEDLTGTKYETTQRDDCDKSNMIRSSSSSSSSSNIFFNIDGLKATRLSGHSKIDGVLPLSTLARVTCMHHQMNELTEGEKWRAHVFCE